MKFCTWNTIKYMTFCICLCATVCLSIYSISRFCENEDITMVQMSKYHSSEDRIYPSFSFCILPPFLEKEFYKYKDDGINVSSYSQFLKGEIWNESLLQIDYDNVTISLKDNMISSYYVTQDEKRFNWNPVFHVSFRSSYRKCFTIDAPYIDKELLWYFGIYINNNIFPSGARNQHNKIFTYLHYPGQRFTAYYTAKTDWISRENMTKSYKMKYKIKNVNVIVRRNKSKDPCFENWKSYDGYIMDNLMLKTGCRPPHWTSSENLPLCNNATQMKKFSRQPATTFLLSLNPPCKSIVQLDYTYFEKDNPYVEYYRGPESYHSFEKEFFHLYQEHDQPTFTERIQTRGYTLDDLVGTIGGYIGLFTGYALVQFPELIRSIVNLCKR